MWFMTGAHLNDTSRKDAREGDSIYETLSGLQRGFERVLKELEGLEQHKLFRGRQPLKSVELAVLEARAWTMFEILDVLHEHEEHGWARAGPSPSGTGAAVRTRCSEPDKIDPAKTLRDRSLGREKTVNAGACMRLFGVGQSSDTQKAQPSRSRRGNRAVATPDYPLTRHKASETSPLIRARSEERVDLQHPQSSRPPLEFPSPNCFQENRSLGSAGLTLSGGFPLRLRRCRGHFASLNRRPALPGRIPDRLPAGGAHRALPRNRRRSRNGRSSERVLGRTTAAFYGACKCLDRCFKFIPFGNQ